MSNLSGLFDDVNTQVGGIAQQVGTKPSSFEPRVFAMIEALSRNVVLPIAGVILTFIACYELIQMITEHNNMAQFEPALILKWIFKTAISVWMISNTFDIIMAVFDVTQQVVANSSGIISGNTRVNDIGLSMLQSSLMQMDVGPLFGLFLQKNIIGITCCAFAHKVCKLRDQDRHSAGYLVKVIVSAGSGLLLNVFTDPFLGYFRNVYIFGQEYTVAQALTKIAGGVTFVNSVASTACAVVLYLALRPALERAKLLSKGE